MPAPAVGPWPATETINANSAMNESSHPPQPLDLSGYSDAAPESPLHLLFIHHSCGGQWLAAPEATRVVE